MGTVDVDQIAADGSLLSAADTKLSEAQKNALLLAALPGATVQELAGEKVVLYGDQVILKRQVHHLGYPWAEHKKRIQIPKKWLDVYRQAQLDALTPRFVGIYHYGPVTIFVDFEPAPYMQRKANNSAAHVSTNDLFQAQTLGQFSREDKNGNRLTSVRADQFEHYLKTGYEEKNPLLEVFEQFNPTFMLGDKLEALAAVQEMHAAGWSQAFQPEWAGFYVEYRLDSFVRSNGLDTHVAYQAEKRKGEFDYDLRLMHEGELSFYGDLKASNIDVKEAPGNDAADLSRCLTEFERFWYVIYEHETWHGKDNGDRSTIEWNEWRKSVGHQQRGDYNRLSYRTKFKEAVRFVRMRVLEVNPANVHIVLADFNQGKNSNGKPRQGKVKIMKKDIDNFLIYTKTLESPGA